MKNALTTQSERLLDFLKKNKTIDPMQAWSELGIYRLGARVYDLKKNGYNIKTKIVATENRYGETCHVAQYELIS